LSEKLANLPLPHVVCEATGGYERPMVEACHKAKILVSVLNPAHTLAASQAQGKRAKPTLVTRRHSPIMASASSPHLPPPFRRQYAK